MNIIDHVSIQLKMLDQLMIYHIFFREESYISFGCYVIVLYGGNGNPHVTTENPFYENNLTRIKSSKRSQGHPNN